MANHKRAHFIFKVKNPEMDYFFIALEQAEGKQVFEGLVTLDLPEGVTESRAREIAEFLQDNLPSVGFISG
jgi:hypothetical protein